MTTEQAQADIADQIQNYLNGRGPDENVITVEEIIKIRHKAIQKKDGETILIGPDGKEHKPGSKEYDSILAEWVLRD